MPARRFIIVSILNTLSALRQGRPRELRAFLVLRYRGLVFVHDHAVLAVDSQMVAPSSVDGMIE